MSRTRTLFAATAVAVGCSTALVAGGVAAADPAVPAPPPIPNAQLPGLPAIEQLSPVIQQAAADPSGAASLLMAAAAAFTGNSAAPDSSRQVADSVSHFVQTPAAPGPPKAPPAEVADPAAHLPAEATAPGAPVGPAHLPSGVNASNVVGPAPQADPTAPLPDAAPAPAPEATPAAASSEYPPTQDFMYPSIGNGCLSDGGNSIALALSVAGPAKIPTPGPGPGQTAYVFTAVGTAGPADVQKLPLNVTWVNLTTGKSGTAALKPHPDINRDGPTTLTAIVDSGSGSIISTIFGQVTTKDKQCNFMPTIGSTVVP